MAKTKWRALGGTMIPLQVQAKSDPPQTSCPGGITPPTDEHLKNLGSLPTDHERLECTYLYNQKYWYVPYQEVRKNDRMAVDFVNVANVLFAERCYQEALTHYTQSLLFAQSDFVKSCVYANRALVLFRVRLYTAAMTDCDRFLNCSYKEPQHLQLIIVLKYLCSLDRKLQIKPKKYQNGPNRLSDEALLALVFVQKLSPLLLGRNVEEESKYYKNTPEIAKPSQEIQSASSQIKIQSFKSTKFLVAAQNINVGDVIIVEKSYCNVILEDIYSHCHHCLELCYNLIPCHKCTSVLYCGENCRKSAFESYHQYICPIWPTLRSMGFTASKLLLVKAAIKGFQEISNQSVQKSDQTTYRSDRIDEFLNQNGTKSSQKVLYNACSAGALVYHLLKEYTEFFQNQDQRVRFKGFIVKLLTAPTNLGFVSEIGTSGADSYDRKIVGWAFYSLFKLLTQSCRPNAHATFYGSTVVVRAIKSLAKGDRCFYCFGPEFFTTNKTQRIKLHHNSLYIKCRCSACRLNLPLLENLRSLETRNLFTHWNFKKQLLFCPDRLKAERYLEEFMDHYRKWEKYDLTKDQVELMLLLRLCYDILGNRKLTFRPYF